MPLYDFRCSNCGHEFDALLTISHMNDFESSQCAVCGEWAVHRVLLHACTVFGTTEGQFHLNTYNPKMRKGV